MKKEKGKDLSVLMTYAGKHKYLTYLSWVLSAVSAVCALMPFVYIWLIIRDLVAASPDYSQAVNVVNYGWMALFFALLTMVIYFGGLMCSHIAAFRIATNMRINAMAHVSQLPPGIVGEIGTGKVRHIVNDASGSTETYLAHQLPDMFGAVATPLAMIVLLFLFDWQLGLLSLIPVVLAFSIMIKMTGKRMAERMKNYQAALDDMNNEAVEYIRGIPVVKTFNQTVFSFKRFKGTIDRYQKWVVAYTKELRAPMLWYTVAINSVFAVLIAAALIITRSGVDEIFFVNLLFYIIFTPIISVTMTKIMFASENKMIVRDAITRLDSILKIAPLPDAENPQEPADNSISLEHVSFRYHNAERDAVKNVSLSVQSGQTIALVGPSGGGKTTCASLIARFWDVTGGAIKIGGVNVRDIDKKRLNEIVSFVFQDSKLLKTSILENVRLARPSAARDEVDRALHAAQCDDIIAKFPDGVNTVIGTKGVYLSGGEQQRIAIARLMLKDSPVVILDEATAFADPENESMVQKAFERLAENKTVVMIAHRLTTVRNADRIFVLDNGRVAESGTHDELMADDGLYRRMWDDYQTSMSWKIGGREQ